MNRGRRTGICLVIGSAGAGKTSLLQQWMESQPAAEVCWINVDEADREPVRFWKAVLTAVERTLPGFGEEARDFIDADGVVGPNAVEALIDAFALIDPPLTVILDDLHLALGEIDDSLQHLIARRPPSLRLVMGSRSELPVDLGRLRTSEVVVEIRDQDLVFERTECAEVLGTLGLSLADADLDVLVRQTEGWAAGVHLAGLALSRSGDPSKFVRRLAASSETIAHYLSTRVLDAQPLEVAEFMLDTCVVDELTPDLAAALSGGTSVALHDVEAAQLMLFRNSASPDVFRYHHLLLQLLRLRLSSTDPERERRLRRIAADWYGSHGELAGSFHQLWRAGEHESAMVLLQRNLYDGFVANSLPDLDPREIVLTDDDVLRAPGAAIGVANALCIDIRHRQAELLVRRIERLAANRLDPAEVGHLQCVRTFIAAGRCDMESTVEYGDAALVLASQTGLGGEAYDGVAAMVSKAYAWAGNWEAAAAAAAGVEADDRPSVASIEISAALANLEIFRGCLGAGIEHARRNRALVAAGEQYALSPESNGVALLGTGLLERGDAGAAERLFGLLDDPAERPRLPPRILAHLGMSRIQFSRGDVDAASESLDAARNVVPELDESSCVAAHIERWVAHQRFMLGDIESSAEAAAALPDGVSRQLAECRLLLADGNVEGAMRFVDVAAERSDCLATELDVALARLTCSLAVGGDVDAGAAKVLSLAGREGFIFRLAEAGGTVFETIQRTARRMPRSDFVEAVLRTMPHAVVGSSRELRLVESLSDRELSVLRYLATSMSYREIAGEMFVSVNTLKTHVKNTFRKLDASSRDEALANGRASGYL